MALTPALLTEAFRRRYPGESAVTISRAPGRVNLIGEHTDYNLGFVLPIALDLACYACAAPAAHGKLRVWSENMGEELAWPVDALGSLSPARDWGDYVAGVARELVKAGYAVPATDLLIHSTVPGGSGLSSSASLEVSVALALLGGRPIEPLDLIRLCRRAENEFVGMPCGIMDQYVSVRAEQGAAICIDCRSLDCEIVRLPAEAEFIAVNTMVKHELGQSAYRDRVRECAAAVEGIKRRHAGVASLRDAAAAMVEEAGLDDVVRRRARHIVTENARVQDFIAASRAGGLAAMGKLFVASHESLRDDYEVSCEELDFLVETALAVPGVYGARMTGGGFGGCIVAMMDPSAAEPFRAALARHYGQRYRIKPQFYPCHPSAGASVIEPRP